MILYSPIDGNVLASKPSYRPRTCFVMTQLGRPIPTSITEIRSSLTACLRDRDIAEVDAQSAVTGRDFLAKIWGTIIAVPLGIGIIDDSMSRDTFSNIFFEIGMLQAYGKETLIIKTRNTKVPSDFVRTEYVDYEPGFQDKIHRFLDSFLELPDHYDIMAHELEKNPLLSIDYLRRAYLITGDDTYRRRAKAILKSSSIKERAKNSVEMLLANF